LNFWRLSPRNEQDEDQKDEIPKQKIPTNFKSEKDHNIPGREIQSPIYGD